MDRKELEDLLSRAVVDAEGKPFNRAAFENGPKGFDVLLEEAGDDLNEIKLFLSDDGCPTKFSQHVLVYAFWNGQLLGEFQRKLPDGTIITVKADGQLISETARKGEPHNCTAWFGILEEILKHLRKAGITVSIEDLKFLGAGKTLPPRPSTVYLGWRSQRIVYRALWDLSYRKEQPWQDGLDFEDMLTTIYSRWFQASPEFLQEVELLKRKVLVASDTNKRYIGV